METLIAIAVGLGLSAATGMRVFLPLFLLGLAGHYDVLPIAEGWGWVASPAALVALGVATFLEIAAYYVPWLDNALDAVATPAALVAGVIATGSVLVDMPPLLKWSVAIVGGGGIAGITQGATVVARLKSGTITGGLGNPILSTLEWIMSLVMTVMAILLPLLAVSLVAIMFVMLTRRAGLLVSERKKSTHSGAER